MSTNEEFDIFVKPIFCRSEIQFEHYKLENRWKLPEKLK